MTRFARIADLTPSAAREFRAAEEEWDETDGDFRRHGWESNDPTSWSMPYSLRLAIGGDYRLFQTTGRLPRRNQ